MPSGARFDAGDPHRGERLAMALPAPVVLAALDLHDDDLLLAAHSHNLAEAGTKLVRGVVPGAALMSAVGLLALAANAVVLGLLWRHRADDLNMRSVWLCSRNDVVANVGVLVAALGVRLTDRAWPDIVVGVAIAGLLVMSAAGVIRAALWPAAADRAA